MRIEPAIGVDAGVQHQAQIVAVSENAVHERPADLAQLLFALGVPKQVLALLADRNVGMHAAAIHSDHRFGQERRGETHLGGYLAADQLVKLDLVGGIYHFRIGVVNFKLRRRHLGMVLLVLESHGALHFGGGVDESAQRIAGQRVIVAAGVDVIKLLGFMIMALGLDAVEEKAFNLVGGVEGVALALQELVGIGLEHAANVGGIRRAALVDDIAEHQHFAGPIN